MATSVVHEADDLNTCAVCFEQYNFVDRLPKFLSCLHTFCISCLGVNTQFCLLYCNFALIYDFNKRTMISVIVLKENAIRFFFDDDYLSSMSYTDFSRRWSSQPKN